MKTLNIIIQLEQLALNQPHKITPDIWADIKLLMMTELKYLKDYFPSDQFSTLSDTFDSIISKASQATRFGDIVTIRTSLSELKGIAESFPVAPEKSQIAKKALFDHEALIHFRENTSIVIGDSHTIFFAGYDGVYYEESINDINLCPQQNNLPFSTIYIGSCLAYTCMKPDSHVNFYSKLQYLKEQFIKPEANIILSLGEIDIRSHVFKQQALQNKDYRLIIDDILSNYQKLIISLHNEGYHVFCWGPVGTQKDSLAYNPIYPRHGSEKERNEATLYFNEQLSSVCQKEGAGFLSIFKQLVDEHMETRPDYLSSDNFHLGPKAIELALPLFKTHKLC